MARTNLADYLQVYPFWLMDVAPVELLSLPLFTPVLGFSQITTPEMTMDMFEVNEANWLFTKKVIRKGSVGTVTLSRGAHWIESDFYKWILTALQGDTGSGASIGGATPRRDLLLVHFMSRSPFGSTGTALANAVGLTAVTGVAASLAGGGVGLSTALNVGGAAAVGALGGIGPVEFAARVPAKAWMLYNCVPSRYKAGSDLDAAAGDVSINQLDIEVEYFDEIGLMA